MDRIKRQNIILPLIPLREVVTFPAAIVPILVGRERSINALKYSMEYYNNFIFLSVQKNQITETPDAQEVAEIGVIAKIERSAEQENGSFRVIIHGLERARINRFVKKDQYFLVSVSSLEEIIDKEKNFFDLSRDLITIFEEYISLKRVKLHGIVAKLESNRISEITDVIASVINIPLQLKQSLLEELDVHKRAVKVFNILKKEMVKLRATRDPDVRRHREEGGADNEVEEYRRKLNRAGLPENVKKTSGRRIGTIGNDAPLFRGKHGLTLLPGLAAGGPLDNGKRGEQKFKSSLGDSRRGSLWIGKSQGPYPGLPGGAAIGQQAFG
jgi:ATP-dependent Lon protease